MMFVIDSQMFGRDIKAREVSKNTYEILDDNNKVIDTIELNYKEAHDEEGRYFVVEQDKFNKISSYKKM